MGFSVLCRIVSKVFVIWLAFIYALSATGATVHLHYCCGEPQKLVSQHDDEKSTHESCPLCLPHQENEKDTAGCGGHSENGCETNQAGHGHCQNVKVEAKKITEEHLPGGAKKLAKIYPLELLVFTLTYAIDLPSDIHHSTQTVNDSPPNVAVPLFIQHCTYRI